MSKKEIRVKGAVTLKTAAAYLQDIVSGLKSGTIRVQNCDDQLTLEPEDLIDVEIEAKQRAGKESIVMELSWRKMAEQDQELDLKIAAQAPAGDDD